MLRTTLLFAGVILLAGCSLCPKGEYSTEDQNTKSAALSRKEEILVVEQLADRTMSLVSIDYLFRDRRIFETDSTYEVHYTICTELIQDTVVSGPGGEEDIVVIWKKSLRVKGLYGY